MGKIKKEIAEMRRESTFIWNLWEWYAFHLVAISYNEAEVIQLEDQLKFKKAEMQKLFQEVKICKLCNRP